MKSPFSKKKSVAADPNLPGILRIKVREVLLALPKGRKAARAVIASGVVALGFDFNDEQLDEAIEWNHKRNLIDYEHNYTYDRDEWFLSDKGRKHE